MESKQPPTHYELIRYRYESNLYSEGILSNIDPYTENNEVIILTEECFLRIWKLFLKCQERPKVSSQTKTVKQRYIALWPLIIFTT